MLIQQIAGTACTLLFQRALGFAAAELDTIGLGLLGRLMPRGALLEALQIDQIPHDLSHLMQKYGPRGDSNKNKKPCGILVL
jgi:hypothetical protein